MSNAISTNGSANKTSTDAQANPGLKIERVFSDPAVHPFDQVQWARRTAEIKDETGNAIFQQVDCEFPESWSQLAVNVVASKYFYGDPSCGNGSPVEGKREYSIRQLVGRVVDSITTHGFDNGYFASREDAYAFENELSFLCVNQYGAFNSPVWFNAGLYHEYMTLGNTDGWCWDKERDAVREVYPNESYKYPQISACFIQSVEDNMQSIMDLAKAEAMLFKSGSGTGTDLSTLRSTKEKLAGGGKPSGPVSFFRVYDTIASIVKSGGKTRRAARMQTLRCDHPDVLEFLECKGKEDKKARALIAAGYSAGLTGDADEAYSSVAFQNTNISIRLTDEFMAKAEPDGDPMYWTKAVVDGSNVEQLSARDVLTKIAEETWACGDPGVQYHDTINEWHTVPNTDAIYSSNPCSEYMHLNDSACNLASLNLLKFIDANGEFDVDRFKAAVRIFIIAQEILVGLASYPTKKIAQNSHDYRPLGLGYANLGALLMTSGVPYDSDMGRSYAGAVTAIMQGHANFVSTEIAKVKGAFNGFAKNAGPMMKVMEKHYEAITNAAGGGFIDELWAKACDIWFLDTLPAGRKYGFRNSQVTVLAPTGTIAFMMDCDTTGLEPDLALVKYKKLAGGGNLKITNQAVPSALKKLGYSPDSVDGIVAYISKNDTIEGVSGLKDEHLPVFDCAFAPPQGGRSIHWKGHVKMMAAIQPFISGALSKTVNLPAEATVEDIRNAYTAGWRLGLKAMAIYRDGSKGAQPLNTKAESKKDEPVKAEAAPRRERLPATRQSRTHKFDIQGHEGYINVGFYPDGRAGELFVTMAKEGSTIGGLMDAWATAISIGLQYGVPLEVLVEKFAHSRFEPSGFSKNADIPMAKSLTDYISRWLGMELINGYREANSPNRSHEEAAAPAAATQKQPGKYQQDSPACSNCGAITIRAGSCYLCTSCGTSSGCG